MSRSNPLTRGKKRKAKELFDAGKLSEAGKLLEQVCKTDARDGEAWAHLGTIYSALGNFDKAIKCLGSAVQIEPSQSMVHHNLAYALQVSGELEKAIVSYKEAIRLQPDFGHAHCNIGTVYEALQRFPEAVRSYREAVRLSPRNADMHYNLGNALLHSGALKEAEDSFRSAISLDPSHAGGRTNLGVVNVMLENFELAENIFREGTRFNPDHAPYYENLGKLLRQRDAFAESIEFYRTAVRLDPNSMKIQLGLAYSLWEAAYFSESIETLRHILDVQPDLNEVRAALIFQLNYLIDWDPSSVFTEHRTWGQKTMSAARSEIEFANSRESDRPLRIGYVSGDFRNHSVAFFIEAILAQHDRERFETFCYANVAKPDEVTERLRRLADHWREISELSDNDAKSLIRRDQIDILVDLAGHSGKNRLSLFAHKPAPIQVSYLGYPNTTGLSTVDFRFTDGQADPDGQDQFYTEQLIRLPRGFLCYEPPKNAPAIETIPGLTTGHITFGSFNNLTKVGPRVVALWSNILRAVPHARLVLKSKSLRDESVRKRYLEQFSEHGIRANDIDLIGWLEQSTDHLALYNRIDIALDTFPYNGTTTTCEALWMGVPVVTLAGDRHAGRVGVSLLTQVGLPELIAESPDDYVKLAVALAANTEHLKHLRSTMRERMLNSPLCDAKGFTRSLEDAYREMWRVWCVAN